MKLALARLLTLPFAGAFIPMAAKMAFSSTKVSMGAEVVTGREGKAAKSAEEDIMLTMKIILDHADRSATVSKEQFISQMEQIQKEPKSEPVDLSVVYDAPAKLAYEASDKSMAYGDFKTKYEADAIAEVIAKKNSNAVVAEETAGEAPADLSVVYDAPAKLAYESSDKSMAYGDFKTKYEADAIADVIAKRPVDLSVVYDAPAKLAYEGSDKSMAYGDFKAKYEADAIADVIAKRPVDLSVVYDAPAKLAYEASDKSMPYGDFKTKYESNAIAEVIAKKNSNAVVAEVTAGEAPADLSVVYDAPAKLAYEGSDKSMAYGDFKTKYEADAIAEVIAKQKVLC
jgi:methionine-rich copper-binding protein CopC